MENNWDNVGGDVVVCISREKVLQALNGNRKSPWTFSCNIGLECC